MKAQLWIHFLYTFPLVQHFIQPEYTGGWSLHLEITRKRLHLFHASADIQYANRCIYSIWSCAPCRIDIGKGEFHSYTEEGFFTIRCSDMLWDVSGLTRPQNRFLVGSFWECGITKNTLAKWVCVSLYSPCTPTKEPNGSQAESSEQYCGACHHNDLRPAQQTDLGQVMWSTEAHLLLYGHYHGDLISLYSGITGDSSVNWQNTEEVGQQLQQPVVEKSFAASKNEEKG